MAINGMKIGRKGMELWRYEALRACAELEYPMTEDDLSFICDKNNGEVAVQNRMISIRKRL